MSSNKKPLVVVSGATGQQGGAVARVLLGTGKYRVRGLTRKVDSQTAKELSSQGIEVFKADLSIRNDVKNALKGADIAWIVTNFWDPSIVGADVTEEERQGKMIADVAKEEGIKWLFYSSLVDARKLSNGKYEVVHFTGKNKVEEYIRSLKIPSTFIYLGFYGGNIGTFFPLKANPDGSVDLYIQVVSEDTVFPIVDPTDTGPVVAKILEEGIEKWNGKQVSVASEYISFRQIAETLTKVTGTKHKVKTLTQEELKNHPELDSHEMIEMLKFFADVGYYGKDTPVGDISTCKKLHPNMTTFEQYAKGNWKK